MKLDEKLRGHLFIEFTPPFHVRAGDFAIKIVSLLPIFCTYYRYHGDHVEEAKQATENATLGLSCVVEVVSFVGAMPRGLCSGISSAIDLHRII